MKKLLLLAAAACLCWGQAPASAAGGCGEARRMTRSGACSPDAQEPFPVRTTGTPLVRSGRAAQADGMKG
ncbi:MAG TPA: hypothetical protein H9819_04390 [Candidatus Bacteroides merdipullorum]|uniref:Uncharacterized protein n=1 Tax=Candidatus Bacteroides merdipullorum TaxID=2838474 RepID=A0A9D2CXE3_9BACE|nr:hypothetical protein [Candidatus Bacteroides merdipullorum]